MADAESTLLSLLFPETIDDAITSPSPVFTQSRLDWSVVDSLWGGTTAMRLAGKRFLPQEPDETEEDYTRRINRTTLHNTYKRTIQAGVAKVFTKDPHFENPVQALDEFAFDVDTQGRALGQFAKDFMEDGINHGISYLLVDYAAVPFEYPTLADELASGNRPYWVKISAPQVLDARFAKFSNGERLSYFKFKETVVAPTNGVATPDSYEQIRVFRQDPARPAIVNEDGALIAPAMNDTSVFFAVYRKSAESGKWERVDGGEISSKTIPVVPFYTNKVGFFNGRPPLMDLAEINIEHWQAKSDYNNILHVVSVPILHATGMKEQLDDKGKPKKMTVAPNRGVISSAADAKLTWVEHGGASISAGRQNLQDLQETMERLGLRLTMMQTAGVSATANAINTAEANSLLKSYALNLQDALNAAVDLTCELLGFTNENTRLIVNTEYAVDYTTNSTMADVLKSFELGIIDAFTVIAEGKRRNVFDNAAKIVPPVSVPNKPVEEEPVASLEEALDNN